MKYSIAYLPEEQADVQRDVAELRRLHPDLKMRESDRHPPYQHIYLTIKKPTKPHENGKKD